MLSNISKFGTRLFSIQNRTAPKLITSIRQQSNTPEKGRIFVDDKKILCDLGNETRASVKRSKLTVDDKTIGPSASLLIDISNNPEYYDVRINDVRASNLIELGLQKNLPHLERLPQFSSPPPPLTGVIYGENDRLMLPLECKFTEGKQSSIYRIWFLIDTTVPYVYLSKESFVAFYGPRKFIFTNHGDRFYFNDDQTPVDCCISQKNFSSINLLGIRGLKKLKSNSINFDWKNRQFQLLKD